MTDEERFERDVQGLAGDSASKLQLLNDLTRPQQSQLRSLWPTLRTDSRRRIVRQMVELAELSVELDFNRALVVALDDDEADIRAEAIDGLWEDESTALLRRFMEKLAHDPSDSVREAVLRSLARFTGLAVTGKLDGDWPDALRQALVRVADDHSATLEARRRAIEAVAVFPDDEAVLGHIAAAYEDRRLPMRASALYAMGRNLDPRWVEPVLVELTSSHAVLRFEAARACGELGNQRAVPALIDLLSDSDREAQLAAVAALGKLGGSTSGAALRKVLGSDDEVLRDAAEEALDELNFVTNALIVG